MKSNLFKIGVLLLGTAGLALLSPKAINTLKKHDTPKNQNDEKTRAQIDPAKINFC